MLIICSWHGGIIGEKEGEGVTHTVCQTCKAKLNAELIRLANIHALNAVEDVLAMEAK